MCVLKLTFVNHCSVMSSVKSWDLLWLFQGIPVDGKRKKASSVWRVLCLVARLQYTVCTAKIFNMMTKLTVVNYTLQCLYFIIIIIIKSPRASRRIRPTHSQTNTPCPAPLPWLHSNSSTLPCFSLSLNSSSPSGLWSPSRSSPSGVHPNAA